jgi:TRAP-type mannitol/chloroaromatic compound transport system permease small subunit
VGRLARLIARLCDAAAVLAMLQALALAGGMVFEVVCRFGFNAPNAWAYDVAYMLAGTLFYLGAGYTLRCREHVTVDFLSGRLPRWAQEGIRAVFLFGAFIPMLGWIGWTVAGKAWSAYATAEVNYTSPWAPLMWPFYAAIAVGLLILFLQSMVEAVASLAHTVEGTDAR